jgi:hypothetical protein
MVSLAISDGAGGGALIDASELVAAVLRLVSSGTFDPVGPEDHALPEPYKRVHELAAQWNTKRQHLERIELEQVKHRAATLAGLLRGNDVRTHLSRLDRCITGIATELPGAASDKVSAWRQAYPRIMPQIEAGRDRLVENLIIGIEEGDVPSAHLQRLCWLSTVPARDLQDLLNLSHVGEQTVAALNAHARDCVREASGPGSLADIKAIGRNLGAAVSGVEAPKLSE